MVKINQRPNKITLVGHANYAPHGKDIVCSAISALLQTFITSTERLVDDDFKCEQWPGEAIINYDNESLSTGGKLLMSSFLLGLKLIAEDYPEHVSFESND